MLTLTLLAIFTLPPDLDRQLQSCADLQIAVPSSVSQCRLFVPTGDAKKRYPLVVFRHGGGGRGVANEHLREGNGMLVQMFVGAESQRRFPAFVLAPQTSSAHDARAVLALVDAIVRRYPVDRSRLYLFGQSLGGFGAWDVLSLAPNRFAAAVIIAAGGDAAKARRFSKTPVWFFHGERDAVIPVDSARRMADALRRAGGTVRLTEYPGEGHGLAWLVVRENELVPWLFQWTRDLHRSSP